MMVVQYACDQLIGIDNANIKECLASDAQNIRMLSKKNICFVCFRLLSKKAFASFACE